MADTVIAALEAIDGDIVPWLVLGLLVAGIVFSGYKLARGIQRSTKYHVPRMDLINESLLTSRADWKAEATYAAELQAGPQPTGVFKNWFATEVDICQTYLNAWTRAKQNLQGQLLDYPADAKSYLAIVGESRRKPEPWWELPFLLVLLLCEGATFALIVAGWMTETGSQQVVVWVAVALALVFASALLYFARWVGQKLYVQGYTRHVWLDAPNHACDPTFDDGPGNTELGIGGDEDARDQKQHASVRRVNRSFRVKELIASAKDQTSSNAVGKPIRRVPLIIWGYLAGIAVLGACIGAARVAQINEHYKSELQSIAERAQAIRQFADTSATEDVPKPLSVQVSSMEEADIMTQERLEAETTGKKVAVVIFVIVFFMAQSLGVLLSHSRGFASSYGEAAFRQIKDFTDRYGDISYETFEARKKQEVADEDRFAQDTLQAWQSGLRTHFNTKNAQLPRETEVREACDNSSCRTYARFKELHSAGQSHAQP